MHVFHFKMYISEIYRLIAMNFSHLNVGVWSSCGNCTISKCLTVWVTCWNAEHPGLVIAPCMCYSVPSFDYLTHLTTSKKTCQFVQLFEPKSQENNNNTNKNIRVPTDCVGHLKNIVASNHDGVLLCERKYDRPNDRQYDCMIDSITDSMTLWPTVWPAVWPYDQ